MSTFFIRSSPPPLRSVTASALSRTSRSPDSPPHRSPPRIQLRDIDADDRVGAFLVELLGINAPDVVRLEDLRVEHGADPNRVPRNYHSRYGAETRNGTLRRPRRVHRGACRRGSG